MSVLSVLLISCVVYMVSGIDNGLGITPPMGWRSWNCYHGSITQDLIESVIDAMVDTSRQVNGKPTSLQDIGYAEAGVDDNWQVCLQNGSDPGHYFHNASEPNGWPILNTQRFQDLKSLVSYAHSKKMGLGWYMNNCICNEHNPYPANEVNDVNFLRMYDFDGIKLDGCSSSKNISNWQYLINTTSDKPLLTENCHNGPNYANLTWCPMNFFRSSSDINTYYPDVIGTNLQSVIPYSSYPGPAITRPGCFAYPDMLEVGNFEPESQFPDATVESMDRSHFGAWCTVSAPLILGYDLTNSTKTDRVWPVITNDEAIAVSQTWAGHPGTLLDSSTETIYYEYPERIKAEKKISNAKYDGIYLHQSNLGVNISGYQIWGKPQMSGSWAVIMLNNNGYQSVDLTLNISVIPNLNTNTVKIRSIWDKKDLGTFTNTYTAKGVLPFDSAFLMVTPS